MFGIFKRLRELEKAVRVLDDSLEDLRAGRHYDYASNKERDFRLTVRPGWIINDDYWRPAVVDAVARTGVLARYPAHTEVLTLDKIQDAYPPEQALKEAP